MVVFTCNHCGESLQKPRVEKHYYTVCRRPKSLSCVDCFKDFKDEEFVAHTKCITEEERYSAKGTFAQGIVKKGDVKQESWTEMIRSIVDTEQNMRPSLKNLFNTISTFNNIPRKKVKFINFLKSSSGGRINLNDIEAAWDLIEKHKAKSSSKPQPAVENGNDVKTDKSDVAADEPPKKKKKRSKAEKTAENGSDAVNDEINKSSETTSENCIAEKTDVAADEPPKKKKKRSKTTENQTDEVQNKEKSKLAEPIENGNEHKIAATDDEPPKKKKKNKKAKNGNANTSEVCNGANSATKENQQPLEETQAVPETFEKVIENESKKKKKSKSVEPIENGNKRKIDATDDAPPTKKNKSSKSKKNGNDDTMGTNGDVSATTQNQEAQAGSVGTFCFKDTILSILRNQNSFSTKKLQKKVLGAYLKETGNSEYSNKTVKKYNKILRKVSNVTVENDIVTLTEC